MDDAAFYLTRFEIVFSNTQNTHKTFLRKIAILNSSLTMYIPVCLRFEALLIPEMCSERDSPLKRLYRRTHAKLTRLAGSGQLVWAADCELSLALVHARRPAWPGETSETILRVAPPRKTRPPDHTRVNWPVDASASGSAQVGPGGRHGWAARVQVGQEPARQKAREGYPSHYTSLLIHGSVLTHFAKLSRAMQAPWVDRFLNNEIYCYPLSKKRCGPRFDPLGSPGWRGS